MDWIMWFEIGVKCEGGIGRYSKSGARGSGSGAKINEEDRDRLEGLRQMNMDSNLHASNLIRKVYLVQLVMKEWSGVRECEELLISYASSLEEPWASIEGSHMVRQYKGRIPEGLCVMGVTC